MAYEVITQGGGEGLSYTFNAVAALFNGRKGFGVGLIYIAGCFATALAVMTLVIKQELLPSSKWFFGSLIMTTALMTPKVDILIKDRITGFEKPVANVPFMLGAFAGIASQLGDVIAEKFDSLFSKAGGEVMNYRKHGIAMASQLAAKAASFTISNPDQAANVRAFVQNCMVFDIAKGKYSIQELVNASDTWEFLKTHASPIRGFPHRDGKGRTKIVTCKEAVSGEEVWKAYVLDAAKRYGPAFFPFSTPRKAATELLANMELSYQYLTGLSVDAANILKQNMVRNAIRESLLELNQLHDSSAAITAYAVSRAETQQKTAYALQGKMASTSLSTLKIVIEVLFYGMFPMIVALAIFPGGIVAIKKYLIALFWIQSWAPMYSILNMLVNVYGKAKSTAAVTLSDGSRALAFSTIPRLGEANEWIEAVAGYAMMSIPFLSYGIIHYGAGALSQLATHFGSQTQSSASHAAEEATTGNYQLGNTSFDNHNRSNVNAFKHDTNAAISAGKTSVQNLDGSLLHQMPNHERVLDRRPAISELGASFNESLGISHSLNKLAEQSHRAGLSHLESAQEHFGAVLSNYQSLSKQWRNDKSASHSWSQTESVMEDSALSRLNSASQELADALQVDVSAANKLLFSGKLGLAFGLKASVGLGKGGLSVMPKGVDVDANAHLGFVGSHEETTLNSEQQRKVEAIQEKYDVQNLLKKAEQESREGRYTDLDARGRQYDTGIRGHLDQGISEQTMAQASFAEEKAYRTSAQLARVQGVESTQNVSQSVFKELVAEHGVEEAMNRLTQQQAVKQVRENFIDTHAVGLEQQYGQQTAELTPEKLKAHHQQAVEQVQIKDNPAQVYQNFQNDINRQAKQQGLKGPLPLDVIDQVEGKIKSTEQIIQNEEGELNNKKAEMQKKYETFSEDNHVKDISGAVKKHFKRDKPKDSEN